MQKLNVFQRNGAIQTCPPSRLSPGSRIPATNHKYFRGTCMFPIQLKYQTCGHELHQDDMNEKEKQDIFSGAEELHNKTTEIL